jgi:hypothetical protein
MYLTPFVPCADILFLAGDGFSHFANGKHHEQGIG